MSINPVAAKRTFRLSGIVFSHLFLIFAPFTFTWPGFWTFLLLTYVTGCLGAAMCNHRLLSHRSFKTYPWFENVLMYFAALSLQGDPIWWAVNHRMHHHYTETEQDPHSPQKSFFWAHVGWMLGPDDPRWNDAPALIEEYTPELANNHWAKYLAENLPWVSFGFCTLLFWMGLFIGGEKLAWSLFIWGGPIRTVYVFHLFWLVNSASHIWGYRNYPTAEDSRNLPWVAYLNFGESWHNNHHAYPGMARNWHKWWEFDLTYASIWLLEKLGLVWDVQKEIPQKMPGLTH